MLFDGNVLILANSSHVTSKSNMGAMCKKIFRIFTDAIPTILFECDTFYESAGYVSPRDGNRVSCEDSCTPSPLVT